MSRNAILTCVSSLLLNMGFVLLGRGSFLQVVAVGLMLLLALAIGSFGCILYVLSRPPGPMRETAMAVLTTGAVGASCLLSLPIGAMLHQRDVARATDFCEKLRSELERYRQVNGHYPDQLSQIEVREDLPWLLKGEEFYHVRDGAYQFSFTDPSSLLAGYEFDSRQSEWNHWD